MTEQTKKTVIAALLANLGIAIFKLIAAIITGSASMLAETYHSFSDTFNQLFLLLGLRLSKKKPSEQHPFGYGKEQFFWSFIVAIILFGVAGILSVQGGVHKLQHPLPIEHPIWNYAALLVAIILEMISFMTALKELKAQKKKENQAGYIKAIRESKNPALITVFIEDTLALAGLFVATIGITLALLLHNPLYDALASIVIGILLMIFATLLGNEIKKLIIGEGVSQKNKKEIMDIISTHKEISRVHSIKTMHLSSEAVLVAIEVKYKESISVKAIERTNDRITTEIRTIIPKAKVYIEAEDTKESH
jgi:cation diffusion facilitator family transporter